MAQMTLGQWRAALGPHEMLERVPSVLGVPSMAVIRAVNTGRLRLHTFRASDWRVLRAVRVRDLERYRARLNEPAPEVTVEGMKRAFEEIAAS